MSGELLQTILLFGIVAVAATALVAGAWFAVSRRQEGSQEQPTEPADTPERRAIRRARLAPSNDPILAALGLPDTESREHELELEGRLPGGPQRP
jgi:hypothetical protein